MCGYKKSGYWETQNTTEQNKNNWWDIIKCSNIVFFFKKNHEIFQFALQKRIFGVTKGTIKMFYLLHFLAFASVCAPDAVVKLKMLQIFFHSSQNNLQKLLMCLWCKLQMPVWIVCAIILWLFSPDTKRTVTLTGQAPVVVLVKREADKKSSDDDCVIYRYGSFCTSIEIFGEFYLYPFP